MTLEILEKIIDPPDVCQLKWVSAGLLKFVSQGVL